MKKLSLLLIAMYCSSLFAMNSPEMRKQHVILATMSRNRNNETVNYRGTFRGETEELALAKLKNFERANGYQSYKIVAEVKE